MKRIAFYDFGGSDQLRYEDAEPPQPGTGQLLIRVKAAAVNPVDWKIRSGAARAVVQQPMPVVPGGDLAGIVEAVGEGVSGWSAGDNVFCHPGLIGAAAELVAVDAAAVARMPSNLDFVEAASLPLVGLTVVQGFAADGRSLEGLDVLIHNAAGGVGSFAVQYAKAKGARVTGSASAANAEFVRSLGADAVVDFRTDGADAAGETDILMDLVGNQDALALWAQVRPGGSVIRIAGGADAPPEAEAGGVRALKVRVRPNGAQLGDLTQLVESGAIRPAIARIFPLAEAGAAHDLSQHGHVAGKIVLTLD